METVKELSEKAAGLKPVERLKLIEAILLSLDKIDPEIEQQWIDESEARFATYKRGELEAVDRDEVMKRFKMTPASKVW